MFKFNNKIKFTKLAAMFGLDARIALAIFGALSIITGAALYSAREKAKTTAMLTELDEATKAFENYWLDTGTLLPRYNTDKTSSNYNVFEASSLVEDPGIKGWKGPYLNYKKGNTIALKYPRFTSLYFYSLDADLKILGVVPWTNDLCDEKGNKCTLVIHITNNVDDATFHALDNMVDNGDGVSSGRIRGTDIDGDDIGYLYYIPGVPLPNPLG